MTRTRKLTLTVKEFSHLVSESLDLTHVAPSPQSFVDHTPVFSETLQKAHLRQSSIQRIFSRPTPTPGHCADSPQGALVDLFDSPRKMIAWPFSRSPRKNRSTKDEDNPIQEVDDPEHDSSRAVSPDSCSISSLAAASTSSLGSLIPAHERLFQVMSRDSDMLNQDDHVFKVSSASIDTPHGDEPPECSAAAIFGNGSTSSTVASASGISSQGNVIRASFEGSEASPSVAANSEPESLDEDPTPRASTFGSRVTLASATSRDGLPGQRGRSQYLSVVVPSRNMEVLALRPAIGVAPHVPSETESSTSVWSTSCPSSPVQRSSSPTFPTMQPSESRASLLSVPRTPPNARVSSSIALASNLESTSPPFPLGFSPRQRKRAISRSLTPPPLPLPPPTGPLPAVPSSEVPPVPPVPPLPPLLHKLSMGTNPHSSMSSPPRPAIAGTPMSHPTALPCSPGGLRLPSRLSWVNSVRAVLPSPPASPTKSIKSLTGKTPRPHSPSKAEIKRTKELKRPTSIGVIEAADNVQVRRTKSILLLGSRSKSTASLGPKRVQIRADANVEVPPAPKPRRKSSAATVGYPIFSSDPGTATTSSSMQSSELLVLRERRHSAPVLSALDSKATGVSADWTLSLPFCTDTPGNKLLPSPLLTPTVKPESCLEEVQGEDWTLCMPLKVRVGTPTDESTEGPESECTLADTAEEVEMPSVVQLPTPSPSPTLPSPASDVRPLDPEDDESLLEERPPSRASLGPHAGGLDLEGGCGKRASGWHVYGWFDEVYLPEEDDHAQVDDAPTSPAVSESKLFKNHVSVFRNMHDATGRHPSQDSMSTVSTSGATFYSAHSYVLVN